MRAEDRVVTSPLSRSLEIAGQSLVINIFRGLMFDDDWLFEVVDDEGRIDVSNTSYDSDKDALAAALKKVQSARQIGND